MSEYQYYEFLAIDRPLTKEQQAELRSLSSRATITSTRFQNVYHWGGFRGDPEKLMERYFDAFVYVANWGTREFMIRLPEHLLGRETTSLYCACDGLDVHLQNGLVILKYHSEEEEEAGWEEGEGWMESLVPVRGELASGDLRSLYLGWLLCVQDGFIDDDQIEPPVPAGLKSLSAPLKTLAKFLRINEDLIAVAAELSPALGERQPSREEIERWVVALPETEKNELLLRLLGGEANLGAELLQRYRRQTMQGEGARPREGVRTVAELRQAAEQHAEKRRREVERRKAEEQARLERERAAARAKYLDGLVGREDQLWQQVEALVEKKQCRDYDQAVEFVKDLHDLAARRLQTEEFGARLSRLREKYAGRPSFLKRLDGAKLDTTAQTRS